MTAVDFVLPAGSEAAEPPERRGLSRDGVRLLVARPTGVQHRRFCDLPDLLEPGDLVVVNTSATLPAALDVERAGSPAVLHVSASSTTATGSSSCACPTDLIWTPTPGRR